ncbi:hypothetical protein ABK040_004519 [Willaertia magna]
MNDNNNYNSDQEEDPMIIEEDEEDQIGVMSDEEEETYDEFGEYYDSEKPSHLIPFPSQPLPSSTEKLSPTYCEVPITNFSNLLFTSLEHRSCHRISYLNNQLFIFGGMTVPNFLLEQPIKSALSRMNEERVLMEFSISQEERRMLFLLRNSIHTHQTPSEFVKINLNNNQKLKQQQPFLLDISKVFDENVINVKKQDKLKALEETNSYDTIYNNNHPNSFKPTDKLSIYSTTNDLIDRISPNNLTVLNNVQEDVKKLLLKTGKIDNYLIPVLSRQVFVLLENTARKTIYLHGGLRPILPVDLPRYGYVVDCPFVELNPVTNEIKILSQELSSLEDVNDVIKRPPKRGLLVNGMHSVLLKWKRKKQELLLQKQKESVSSNQQLSQTNDQLIEREEEENDEEQEEEENEEVISNFNSISPSTVELIEEPNDLEFTDFHMGHPIYRTMHAGAIDQKNEFIYTYGGYDRTKEYYFNDLWKYDIQNDEWELVDQENLTIPLRDCILVCYQNYLFKHGGKTKDDKVLDSFHCFNLITKKWTNVLENSTIKPPARYCHTGTLWKDSLFIYGGDNDVKYFSDLWEFNFVTLKWRQIYLIPEIDNYPLSSEYLEKLQKEMSESLDNDLFYTTTTSTSWRNRAYPAITKVGTSYHAVALDSYNGILYIQGGQYLHPELYIYQHETSGCCFHKKLAMIDLKRITNIQKLPTNALPLLLYNFQSLFELEENIGNKNIIKDNNKYFDDVTILCKYNN